MNMEKILQAAEQFAFEVLGDESSGHDYWHVVRVANLAKKIAIMEEADISVCVLAALLHDIADEKLNETEAAGLERVRKWLVEAGSDEETTKHVMVIISTMSFKGGTNKAPMSTLEGKVVQDADRLDALGAIGIARTMCYSGFKNRPIHNPNQQVREDMTIEEYRSNNGTAIMHFYEKLFKLKGLMNTKYGKELAEERHKYMEGYVQQFYDEWEGLK